LLGRTSLGLADVAVMERRSAGAESVPRAKRVLLRLLAWRFLLPYPLAESKGRL